MIEPDTADQGRRVVADGLESADRAIAVHVTLRNTASRVFSDAKPLNADLNSSGFSSTTSRLVSSFEKLDAKIDDAGAHDLQLADHAVAVNIQQGKDAAQRFIRRQALQPT